MEQSMWAHLPLLLRSNTKDSVEYILQAMWRTRKTGLDSTDRQLIQDMLQLPNDSDLDPLLVCLRMLIRRCVYENINKDEIQKLFPPEVSPELQRLLMLLLQKFQREWRNDALKDQVSLPRLKAMTWKMANQNAESEHVAVINLKEEREYAGVVITKKENHLHYWRLFIQVGLVQLQDDTQSPSGEKDVKFQLAKDTLETMLKSMYNVRDQLSTIGDTSNGQLQMQMQMPETSET